MELQTSHVNFLFQVVIGQSKVKLDASNNVCANEQCVLGSVMTAAMVYHFRSDNAKIAVFSGGGIRASLPTDVKGKELVSFFNVLQVAKANL